MENCCVNDQKGKQFPNKVGMTRLESFKSRNLPPWKMFHWKLFSTLATGFSRIPTYPTIDETSHQYLFTIRTQCPNIVEVELVLSYAWRYVQLQPNPWFFYDPTKLTVISILRQKVNLRCNCGDGFKKTFSFADKVHFELSEITASFADCQSCYNLYAAHVIR